MMRVFKHLVPKIEAWKKEEADARRPAKIARNRVKGYMKRYKRFEHCTTWEQFRDVYLNSGRTKHEEQKEGETHTQE